MILRVLRGWMSTSKFTTYKDVILQNHEMKKNYMRSSGPGGQSVNTTNSKAEVRVLIKECSTIDAYIANNIRQKYKQFTNKADELIVTSQIHKSQSQNLKQCIMKMQKIIFNCSKVPEQRKYDIPAQTEEQEDARIEFKRRKSVVKNRRQVNHKFKDF